MANDIYNRIVELGEPLAADATRLLIPDIGNEDMLVQTFAAQYQQNVNRLWEVGSGKTFFIAGRTQGTMQLKRVIGGKGIGQAFIRKYADVCNMRQNTLAIQLQAGCTSPQSRGILNFEGVVITSIGYTVSAQDMVINEDLSAMFAKLTLG